jgi:hypothetical protein
VNRLGLDASVALIGFHWDALGYGYIQALECQSGVHVNRELVCRPLGGQFRALCTNFSLSNHP